MPDDVISRTELLEKIRYFLSEILDDPELVLTEEMTQDDVLDWDSVNHVKLTIMLEADLGIRFAPDEINTMTTVADLITLTRSRVARKA